MNTISQPEKVLWESTNPESIFCGSPGICRLSSGRIVAIYAERGPGVAIEKTGNRTGHVLVSDNHGETWRETAGFSITHARPFESGGSVYILGHRGDLTIIRSDDEGETWSEPSTLTQGQRWHQAPCNVHYAHGNVYLVMERVVYDDVDCWKVSVLAAVLMRAKLGDDLTESANWTFASELAFRDAVGAKELDYFGVPFFDTPVNEQVMLSPHRGCTPIGWLETNVVQIVDSKHYWFDPEGKTYHLWARAHTGGTGYAAIAKVVEEAPGRGPMRTELERVASGRTCVLVPCPGGQMKFHVVYDQETALYWLLSTQATDSMTRVELLTDDRYNLPNNQRSRMQLHFSKNMIDWCFAGIVAIGENERASRHYAAMAIDDDDLIILSRSGDGNVRNQSNPTKDAHDGNLVTFHKVSRFRDLAY